MSELKAYTLFTTSSLSGQRVYLKSDADKVIADLEESHKMEVEQFLMEIVKLKDERRWRKCSEELPEVGVEVLVTNGTDFGISDWCGDYWNNDPFCGYTLYNVIAWMPMPKAPEDGK